MSYSYVTCNGTSSDFSFRDINKQKAVAICPDLISEFAIFLAMKCYDLCVKKVGYFLIQVISLVAKL